MKAIFVSGIILLILISPLFNGLFFSLEMYVFFTLILSLASGYFLLKLVNKEHMVFDKWLTGLNILLIFAYASSFFNAVNFRDNIEALIQVLVLFLAFLVIFDYFKDNTGKISTHIIIPLVSIGFIVSIIGLEGYTGAFPLLKDTIFQGRLGSTFQYTNTAAIYFLMCFILTITLMLNTNKVMYKALLAGIGNTLLLSIFFTGSRAVFVIFPVTAVVLFIFTIPHGYKLKCIGYYVYIMLPVLFTVKGYGANAKIANYISASKWLALSFLLAGSLTLVFCTLDKFNINRRFKFAVLGLLLPVFAIPMLLNPQRVVKSLTVTMYEVIPPNIMERFLSINLNETNVIARWKMNKDALKLIGGNWLFGLGGGGWTALYQSVQDNFYTARAVHNHYLQVFVEAGMLGFGAFLGIVVLTCIYLLYSLVKTETAGDRVVITGILCSFVSLAIHSAFDFNLTYSGISLIFWCLVSISTACNFTLRKDRCFILQKRTGLAFSTAILCCLLLMAVSLLYSAAAYYEKEGVKARERAEVLMSIKYYEKAVAFDRKNAAYYSAIAEQYNLIASYSQEEAEKAELREKALIAAENSVKYSPYYPYYNFILSQVYFDCGQYIKAFKQAEKLIALQPKKGGNYDLLAMGYMEAGLQYFRENNFGKSRELIKKCSQIGDDMDTKIGPTIQFYKGKALLLLGEYKKAEELLKSCRGASLKLKMDSDRLLYIINEETGRKKENEKFKHVLWMGMVEKTPAYIEVKSIIKSKKILEIY